ncbi:hypothetical protein BIT28_16395 [Photobacterium proteolyticum]|uniref:Uncharacterized protein n=1 Tax=Photobacterium proteolyticum TaxID=1903952 RepID=A0A1Q9G7K0_9GAMM|nr:hypothetical protein [Photobacterium proteolyticum]OLQ70305.1 hypothetical protein BIT28_16395 [Photobacterium proteolyticum]
MNIYRNFVISNCGTGLSVGEGAQGHFENIKVTDCNKGYVLHQNSNLNFVKSSAVNNKVGVELIGELTSDQMSPEIPMLPSNVSREMQYALEYLKHIVRYNPYE